jgi:hypothetical protein
MLLAERGAIIAQRFCALYRELSCPLLQDAYYTESANSNSRGREYFDQDFRVAEMSRKPEAGASLSVRFDQQNHPRTQHGKAAIVALQGLDRGVVSAGNRGQSFTRLHRMALHRLRGRGV